MLDAHIEMKSSEVFKFRSHNERKLIAIFVHKTARSSYNWYARLENRSSWRSPNLQMAARGSSETAITTTLHNTTFQRRYLSHSPPRERQISHSVQLFGNYAFAVLHRPTSKFPLLHTLLFCTSNWPQCFTTAHTFTHTILYSH